VKKLSTSLTGGTFLLFASLLCSSATLFPHDSISPHMHAYHSPPMMLRHRLLIVFLLLGQQSLVRALNNGLGLVPPMGWNSWNAFNCNIDESKIKDTVDELLKFQDLGYVYFNLDDCWMSHNRTADGEYQADPVRFPSGMRALGDYLHSKGFQFGIYTSAGTLTCAGFPGSLGHEEVDAQSFADWGVDYLKYDNCWSLNVPGIKRYTKMRDALNATGRSIFYSLCQWGAEESWQWAPAVGNSWRTTGDIEPNWKDIRANFWRSQLHARRSGPGAWLDPDMLEVGNGDLTDDENRAHFSLWCIVKAPLLLGMDLTTLSNETVAIISNANLIRINQDPRSPQATCFSGCSVNADWSILATTVSTGESTVVLVVNWSNRDLKVGSIGSHTVGVVPRPDESVVMQDLWTNEVVGIFKDKGTLTNIPIPDLAPHACVVYQLTTTVATGIAPEELYSEEGHRVQAVTA
jgi:alpha-galactosidase